MQTARLVQEIALGAYGGAGTFFFDVDGDGRREVVTYQGPAVFGYGPYRAWDFVKPLFPNSVSVSAFRLDGSRLWTWGTPNPTDRPYTSHSYECVLAAADVDEDGRVEVVVADGSRVMLLDGRTGTEKAAADLPGDNFYIVQCAGEPTRPNEAAIVLKNGEEGVAAWRYGEPVIGLTRELKPAWPAQAVLGGGHHILPLDLNRDGRKEYLIGYCAMALDGRILWTASSVDADHFDATEDHVDYTDVLARPDGSNLFAMAGSSRLHLIGDEGRAIFAVPGPHCQGAAIGRFRTDSEFQVALYNAPDGPMNLYDPSGKEIWARSPERRWPVPLPEGVAQREFHRNAPIVTIHGRGQDWIGYCDGGWPWGMDGEGEVSLSFKVPVHAKQPKHDIPIPRLSRGDDIGYGYALHSVDIDDNGVQEAVICDRRFLWIYRVP